MNINTIIKDLYYYKDNEYNTKYLDKVIKYFEKKQDLLLNKINNNKYELSGIKIHLLYNNNYKFILSNKIIKNYSYRKLKLNENQINNLLNQKYGMDNNNFKICKNIINSSFSDEIYLIIINDNNYKLKAEYINIELAFETYDLN